MASLVFVGATPSSATPATYYLDSTAACPGSGTQASPWCGFSVVNGQTFQPGDQILLKRGDTFPSGMVLNGSGSSTSYLSVGAYGSGASPLISGTSASGTVGIQLKNNSYVQVQGLAIENVATGILINDTTNQTGYRFLYLYFQGDGEGIQSPTGSNSGVASNVLVQDVTAGVNQLSCTYQSCQGSALVLGAVSNVIVNRLDSFSNCGSTNWGLGPGASNVVIENSESVSDGSCYSPGGATANFVNHDSNITFVNDIVKNVLNAGSVDLSAIDVEPSSGPDNGVNIEDSYIAGNAGPGIEVLNWPNPITNVNISGNVFSDNASNYSTANKTYPVYGQIWTDQWWPGSIESTGSIQNNFYNAPSGTGGFEQTHNGANFNQYTQSNNQAASGPANMWFAANDFSCSAQGASGWSYQTSADNANWANLGGCANVDPLDQEWTNDANGGTASGFVSNFEELPPSTSSSWVARSWTAPGAASVSMRGKVLMTDPTCGSGVTAEITKNGSSTPIWGPQVINAGDGVGVDANLDGVSVNAGDVLHFAVQENGSSQCRVSWTPSIAIPNPITTVLSPAGGARLNGTVWLDASASASSSPIKQVAFVVSGGKYYQAQANVAYPSVYGWLATWPTTYVPDGTYTLQSVVTDAAGDVDYSPGVTITVDNALTTSVWAPSNGSWVSGSQVLLDAGASDPTGTLSKVEFHLTGGSLNDAPVATATSSPWGWYGSWDSTTVPDGTYTLKSVAYNTAGTVAYSAASTIIVENTPPPTSMLIPSNGASVAGTQVLLDASTPNNVGVTKVEFHLTGGSLNNALVATGSASYYGWVVQWDSTTVPDGTYTLQSEAYDGAGYVGVSAPISVTVAN
jgi:hypothetical protein